MRAKRLELSTCLKSASQNCFSFQILSTGISEAGSDLKIA